MQFIIILIKPLFSSKQSFIECQIHIFNMKGTNFHLYHILRGGMLFVMMFEIILLNYDVELSVNTTNTCARARVTYTCPRSKHAISCLSIKHGPEIYLW